MTDAAEEWLLANTKGAKPKPKTATPVVDPAEQWLMEQSKPETPVVQQPDKGYRLSIPNEPGVVKYESTIGNPSPVVTPDPNTFTDKIRAGIEAGGGTLTSMVAAVPGIPYGVFNYLTKTAHNAAFPKHPYPATTAENEIIGGIQSMTPTALMPQSELGQKYMENVGTALQGMPVVGAEGSVLGLNAQMASQFAKAKAGTTLSGKPPLVITPLTKMAQEHAATPELQQSIATAEKAGAINPVVAKRHIDADSLPEVVDEAGNKIKVRLTKGMATQDSKLLSDEKNARSVNDPVRQVMDDNGRALPLILQKFREDVAPDINFRNTPEEGQFYIDKLLGVRKHLHDQTTEDYRALHDAAEQSGLTHTPLDAQQFAMNLQERFSKQGLYHEDLPPAVNMRVQKIASGELPLTFNTFEQLRTILGREQRKAASGTGEGSASAAHAIGEVRDVLEDLPLTPEAQQLKPLADKARASAKLDFDLQKRSPAYKAVVEESARPDDFVDKYILGNTKNAGIGQVQNLISMFPDDAEFHQALAHSTLKDIYGQSVNAKGQLSSAKLDKAISSGEDSGKHQMLLPTHIRDGLDRLNKTAQLVQGAPAGAYVQTNPNLSAALAHYANSGMSRAFSMIPIIGEPAVDVISGMRQRFQAKKFATESTKVGAGLDYGTEQPKTQSESSIRSPQEATTSAFMQSAPTLGALINAQNP